MEELIWVGGAVAAVLLLKWWQKRKGRLPAPQEPPGATLPPPDPAEPPATLPFEPPKAEDPPAEPAPKPPLGRLRDWLRRRREARAAAVAAIEDPDKKTERGHQLDIVAHLQREGIDATAEQTLSDGTRVDISTPTYAIEVDFARKWAECIGQALYYGLMTGKKPVCLVLIGAEDREPGLARLRAVCKRERIDVWTYHVKTRELRILGVG